MFKTIRKLVRRLANKCQRKNKKTQVPVVPACSPLSVSLIIITRSNSQWECDQDPKQQFEYFEEVEDEAVVEEEYYAQYSEQVEFEFEVEMQELEDEKEDVKVIQDNNQNIESATENEEQQVESENEKQVVNDEQNELVFFDCQLQQELTVDFKTHYDLVAFLFLLQFCGVLEFKSELLTQQKLNELVGNSQQKQNQVSNYKRTADLKQSKYYNQNYSIKRQVKILQQPQSRQIYAH